MSKATNILIVIITSLVVIAACILNIAGLLGGLKSGTTAEWADLFKWNNTSYINTYTTIDSKFVEEKQGEITGTISRSVDTSKYIPANGEATYLSEGTEVWSIKGYDSSEFLCVDDGGSFFLYCTKGAVPDDLIRECAEKAYMSPVDFVYVSIPTNSKKISDNIVRIRILDSYGDLTSYLDRYSEYFEKSDGTDTYDQIIDDRGYGKEFFEEKKIIAIYVPEESGEEIYSVSSLMSDSSKMTLILKKTVLPDGIKYDTGDTRHMFLEIDAEEYSDQKLTYQLETSVIPNMELEVGIGSFDAMRATVKIAKSLDDLLGTRYEPLVKGIYSREFFQQNMLIIVECSDKIAQSVYTFSHTENSGGYLNINIEKETDENKTPDPRMQYLLIPYAKADYNEEIVVPAVIIDEDLLPVPETEIVTDIIFPDGETTDIPEPNPDETTSVTDDLPDDTPVTEPDNTQNGDEFPTPEPVPVDYTPRDLLVVEDADTVARLSDIYGISEEMYDESFFESYILLFAGDTVASESVVYRYNSCERTGEGIVITVDAVIPEKCAALPACKYIAIPYLRSEYNGEALSAKLNTIYEWEITENDNDGQP